MLVLERESHVLSTLTWGTCHRWIKGSTISPCYSAHKPSSDLAAGSSSYKQPSASLVCVRDS